MQTAEYYWSLSAAAFHDPGNAEMFMHNKAGKVCWIGDNTGPEWNFSSQKAIDWYVDEIGGELTREANINAVFFDEPKEPNYNCNGGKTMAENLVGEWIL